MAEYVETHFDVRSPLPVPEGYTLRHPDFRRRTKEMEKIRLVFNDAFASNWHFLPANKEEYEFAAKFISLITDPSLICIAEHNGEPVGVVMCVLDVNPLLRQFRGRRGPVKLVKFLLGKRHIPTAIAYAVGIRQRYQHTRVYPLLYEACARMLRGFDNAECTWISESNMLARRSAERLGMTPDKHFGIVAMSLSPGPESRQVADNPVTSQEERSGTLSSERVMGVDHG
jgi:hypothetical protein